MCKNLENERQPAINYFWTTSILCRHLIRHTFQLPCIHHTIMFYSIFILKYIYLLTYYTCKNTTRTYKYCYVMCIYIYIYMYAWLNLNEDGGVSIGKGNVPDSLECPPNLFRSWHVHPYCHSSQGCPYMFPTLRLVNGTIFRFRWNSSHSNQINKTEARLINDLSVILCGYTSFSVLLVSC